MTVWDFFSNLIDKITGPKFGNVILFWFIFILAVLIMIEFSRIPWRPLTQFGRFIGRTINQDVLEDQKELHKEIEELEEKVDTNNKENKETRLEDKALDARRRILIFAGEISREFKHSEEEYNQILDDVSFYQDYCKEHPRFPNERANASIKLVRSTFEQVFNKNDFE